MYQLIDGKKISNDIICEIKNQIDKLNLIGIKITLVDIQIGSDDASNVYVQNKIKKFNELGLNIKIFNLPESSTENELLELIESLNADKSINAIFVEKPLPSHINESKINDIIDYKKDVDGFNIKNIGALTQGINSFYPCTAEGIIELLKRSNIVLEGKNCVVIGRSNVVGKPVALLLLKENATVTICHSKTKDIKSICKNADVLIVAIGKAKMIDETYVKEGAIVIDVGIHSLIKDDKRVICGDVDFDKVAPHTSYITPVPDGVGAMTTTMLIKHCIDTALKVNYI